MDYYKTISAGSIRYEANIKVSDYISTRNAVLLEYGCHTEAFPNPHNDPSSRSVFSLDSSPINAACSKPSATWHPQTFSKMRSSFGLADTVNGTSHGLASGA
jgi:hypothetical protein